MRIRVLMAALAVSAGGAAHAQEARQADPLEPFNRSMFAFNEQVDKYVLSPVAHGYRAVTPKPVRTGVSNVLSNLNAPVVFVNDVLQASPKRAGTTFARFGINSTIGVAGIFDVASGAGLKKHSEDFGQTLGRWGVGQGPYIVLPLLGPSTIRDATGQVVDVAFNPLNYAEFDGDDATRIGIGVLEVVSARESAIEAIDDIYETSIDPYVSIRNGYLTFREGAVRNGQEDVQDLPDFEDTPSDTGPAPQTPEQPKTP